MLTGMDVRAAALGIKLSMSLADARAICPDLYAVEAEPEEDMRALDAIAAWCERFTPIVVVNAPGGLFLDVTGCGHLFGDEAELRDQLAARLATQGFSGSIALAPTPGAAWAFARYGAGVQTIPDLTAALAPLPVEALRLDEAAASLLRRLGLKTIGQVTEAPRASFAARAGERALLRLDQALGRAPEALAPRRPPPPLFATRRFLEPIFSVEAMLSVTQALCEDVIKKLEARGAGARQLHLHLFGVDGGDRLISIGVSCPERALKPLMRLFREKLDRAADGLNAEFGIEAARLDVAQLTRIELEDGAFLDAPADERSVASVVDVISTRLGPKAVLRGGQGDTHNPEKASVWRAALRAAPEGAKIDAPKDGVMRRPLTLFASPQPVETLAAVPDGPPIRFRWRRVLREIVCAEGPERISGDWLREGGVRDYYRVEDRQGQRYWIYRDGHYGGARAPRWFVHGLFA